MALTYSALINAILKTEFIVHINYKLILNKECKYQVHIPIYGDWVTFLH